jgi:hypothetical protein
MRKTVALPFAALALASVIAAGCSGTGYNGTSAPTSTPFPIPSTPCTPPPFGLQVVFPRNGDTNAPNLQGIVIAVAPNPLPTNWFFYASFQTSTQITFPTNIGFFSTPIPSPGPSGGPTSTPFPAPSDTPTFSPSFGTPIFESASIGKFANGQSKFTIYLANTNCFPGVAYNTFTTSLNDSPTPTPTPAPTGT